MRIAHITTGLRQGGAESILYSVINNCRADAEEQCVVSLSNSGVYGRRIQQLGVPLASANLKSRRLLHGIKKLMAFVRSYQPDIIVGWMYHGNIAASIVRRIAGNVPVVWTIHHSLHDTNQDKLLTRQIIKYSKYLAGLTDAIIYNSVVSAEQHELQGYPMAKRVWIPNGVNTDLFKPRQNVTGNLDGKYKGNRKCITIGYIGRQHSVKGFDIFIEAASIVSRRFQNVEFVMIGPGLDGTNKNLERYLDGTSFGDSWHLMGMRDDIPQQLQNIDILVLPSRGETCPLVILEGMACEKVCIATDVGDCREVLSDVGRVTRLDAQDVASTIISVLNMTAGERASLGRRAREKAKEKYSVETMLRKYKAAFAQVVQK